MTEQEIIAKNLEDWRTARNQKKSERKEKQKQKREMLMNSKDPDIMGNKKWMTAMLKSAGVMNPTYYADEQIIAFYYKDATGTKRDGIAIGLVNTTPEQPEIGYYVAINMFGDEGSEYGLGMDQDNDDLYGIGTWPEGISLRPATDIEKLVGNQLLAKWRTRIDDYHEMIRLEHEAYQRAEQERLERERQQAEAERQRKEQERQLRTSFQTIPASGDTSPSDITTTSEAMLNPSSTTIDGSPSDFPLYLSHIPYATGERIMTDYKWPIVESDNTYMVFTSLTELCKQLDSFRRQKAYPTYILSDDYYNQIIEKKGAYMRETTRWTDLFHNEERAFAVVLPVRGTDQHDVVLAYIRKYETVKFRISLLRDNKLLFTQTYSQKPGFGADYNYPIVLKTVIGMGLNSCNAPSFVNCLLICFLSAEADRKEQVDYEPDAITNPAQVILR